MTDVLLFTRSSIPLGLFRPQIMSEFCECVNYFRALKILKAFQASRLWKSSKSLSSLAPQQCKPLPKGRSLAKQIRTSCSKSRKTSKSESGFGLCGATAAKDVSCCVAPLPAIEKDAQLCSCQLEDSIAKIFSSDRKIKEGFQH